MRLQLLECTDIQQGAAQMVVPCSIAGTSADQTPLSEHHSQHLDCWEHAYMSLQVGSWSNTKASNVMACTLSY
jgi:hypothetical protein